MNNIIHDKNKLDLNFLKKYLDKNFNILETKNLLYIFDNKIFNDIQQCYESKEFYLKNLLQYIKKLIDLFKLDLQLKDIKAKINATLQFQQFCEIDDKNLDNFVNIASNQWKIYKGIEFLFSEKINRENIEQVNIPLHYYNKFIQNFLIRYDGIQRAESQKKIQSMTDDEKKIYQTLSDIAKIYLSDIILAKKNQSLTLFGSSSLNFFNNDIEVNDIDLYSSNPILLFTFFGFMIKWMFNINLNIHINKLIYNYVTLDYKSKPIIDVFYMHSSIQKLIKMNDQNINILKPSIQLINFFRMMSEIRRIDKINNQLDETKKRMKTLIKMTELELHTRFNISDQKKLPRLELLSKHFVIIEPKKIFSSKITNQIRFNYIIVLVDVTYKQFIETMYNESIFYRTIRPIHNEIFASLNTKQDLTRDIINTNEYIGQIDNQNILIRETKIIPNNKKLIFPDKIKNIIDEKKHNILFMTSISTPIYTKIINNKEYICNISIEVFILNILMFYRLNVNNFLIKELYNEVLSYISTNRSIKTTFMGLLNNEDKIYYEISKFKATEQNMHTFLDVFDNISKRNSYYFSNIQSNKTYSKIDFIANF